MRNHWQFMLQATGVEEMYPYLDFTAEEEGEEHSDDDCGFTLFNFRIACHPARGHNMATKAMAFAFG